MEIIRHPKAFATRRAAANFAMDWAHDWRCSFAHQTHPTNSVTVASGATKDDNAKCWRAIVQIDRKGA